MEEENNKTQGLMLRVLTISLFALSILLYLVSNIFSRYFMDAIVAFQLELFSLVLIFMGFVSAMYIYLKYGFKVTDDVKSFASVSSEISSSKTGEVFKYNSHIVDRMKKLEKALGDIQISGINKEDRLKLFNQFKDDIKNENISKLVEELKEQYSITPKIEEIQRACLSVKSRLVEELGELNRRSTLNLWIGISTALAGLLILGVFVLSPEADILKNDKWFMFTQRISLVVMIEIFAYFFLKLYKGTLEEIKYYQNELTNIESKLIGLISAISYGNGSDVINTAMLTFSDTERNYILKKGESTVNLEKTKIDSQETKEMFDTLLSAVEGLKGTGK